MIARIERTLTNLQIDTSKHDLLQVADFLMYKRPEKLLESNKAEGLNDRPGWMIERDNFKAFSAGRELRNKRLNNG